MNIDEMMQVLRETSADQPDDPDTRTNDSKPAPLSGKGVQIAEPDTPGQVPRLAHEPNILDAFAEDVRRAGLAGETKLAQVTYLALTSRVLKGDKPTNRPVSQIVKGTTSTGKSYATQTVLRFFPPSAYVPLGSMSRRYLFFAEEQFAHRFLVVPEWASIADDDELVALLRTLLSEGRVVHGTVDREGNRSKARRIEKEGPTGLLVTTTRATVDEEMETRCLSLFTDDTRDQTRRVFRAFADLEEANGSKIKWEEWHALQEWIAKDPRPVAIPFVRALGELMPTTATRLRRDYPSLLCLVRAHAILHQERRRLDDGRIVATVEEDYAAVRELVGELIAEGVEASVSQATRETVEAVHALQDEGKQHVSAKAVSERLKVGRSAAYDRIRRALKAGYLVNEAPKDERAFRLVVGASLPDAADFLPLPEDVAEEVVRVCPDRLSGHDFGSTMRDSEPLSGCPGRSAEPGENLFGEEDAA